MGNDGEPPGDQLRERADQSRVKMWVMLEANRWLVTVLLFVAFLVALTGIGYLYPPAEAAIRSGDSLDTLFQSLVTVTITGVTLVLTLNQLVLSQELGAVGDQRERMEGAMQFRQDVADTIQAPVSPSRPAQFLRSLVQVSGERAEELRETIADSEDEELKESFTDFTRSLIENANYVSEGLDDARFGQFDVISSALNFNYSWKIFRARYLETQYSEDLDEAGKSALEDLIEALRLFGPAREHFKTLYFQWDLINLSRSMLGSALPALLVASSVLLYFNPKSYALTVFGVDSLIFVISVTVALSILPFLILLSYVLRIATVTKHTLSIGPFILRETEQVEEVEWNR